MKKKCIFKCPINGKWYRVFECVQPNDEYKTYYQTYVDRRRLDVRTWFCLGGAIGSILYESDRNMFNELKVVWK